MRFFVIKNNSTVVSVSENVATASAEALSRKKKEPSQDFIVTRQIAEAKVTTEPVYIQQEGD